MTTDQHCPPTTDHSYTIHRAGDRPAWVHHVPDPPSWEITHAVIYLADGRVEVLPTANGATIPVHDLYGTGWDAVAWCKSPPPASSTTVPPPPASSTTVPPPPASSTTVPPPPASSTTVPPPPASSTTVPPPPASSTTVPPPPASSTTVPPPPAERITTTTTVPPPPASTLPPTGAGDLANSAAGAALLAIITGVALARLARRPRGER